MAQKTVDNTSKFCLV